MILGIQFSIKNISSILLLYATQKESIHPFVSNNKNEYDSRMLNVIKKLNGL